MDSPDENQFREWLDLDKADENIGVGEHFLSFENTQLQLTTENPSIHQPIRSLNHSPTYALDPALISASIPPLNPTQITHPLILQENHSINDDRDDDQEEQPPAQNTHSRSSSLNLAASRPIQPTLTTATTHKRALSYSHPLINVPDWEDQPSPEEYRLLSSKEKRQLRNKISARNFRHRRKQHISTLEQQLAQRDQTIDSLSDHLRELRLENKDLKSQVEVLKQKWSDLMKKIEEISVNPSSSTTRTSTPPPTTTMTTSTTGAQSSSSFLHPVSPRSRSAKTNGMIPLPNLHKDLGSHTRKPFNGVGGMTGGGNVGVHTTLIPEVTIDVYGERFLTRSERTVDGCWAKAEHDKSPQAEIEAKLARPSGGARREEAAGEPRKGKAAGWRPEEGEEALETGGCLEQLDLRARLLALVFDALQAPAGLDLAKLAGCLDGSLVLALVERAPPAYRRLPPAPPASIPTPALAHPLSNLSRQLSSCQL